MIIGFCGTIREMDGRMQALRMFFEASDRGRQKWLRHGHSFYSFLLSEPLNVNRAAPCSAMITE
jgi:hypothetical protein